MTKAALKNPHGEKLSDRFTFRPSEESLPILQKAREVGLDVSAIINECVAEVGNRIADAHVSSLKARIDSFYKPGSPTVQKRANQKN